MLKIIMKKQNKNQSGFGAIEGILIIVVILLLGVVGYMVYKNQNKAATTAVTSNSSSTSPEKTVAPVKETKANNAGDYLVIKEWGVELPLSAGIKDAYYANLKNNTFSYPVYALGIKSLTALDSNCAAENLSVSLILRQTIAQHDTNSTKNDPLNSPVYDMKIGGYYYGYDRSRAACSDNQKAN